jgi:sterol desaturase/sphingolipid hydroxylase (fatty acid hydroxylase superfamily)
MAIDPHSPFLTAILAWSIFWTTYYVGGLFLDGLEDYKKSSRVSEARLWDTLRTNMGYTFCFQQILHVVCFIMGGTLLDPGNFAGRFIISVLITEVIFYYVHRLMHSSFLYRYHVQHHHFKEPRALSAMFCSPVEALLCNQLSVSLGPLLTGMEFWEIAIWFTLSALNTLKAHSDLHFFTFSGRYHNLHHMRPTNNYGFLFVMDYLHGTMEWPYKTFSTTLAQKN